MPQTQGALSMSSPRRLKAAGLVVVFMATFGAAQAEVACPATSNGHGLLKMGGGRLFDGSLEDNAVLAPDRQATASYPYNFYSIPDPSHVTLVCSYGKATAPVILKLTPDAHRCLQNVNTGGFRCG